MGTWGHRLYDNDTSLDVKDQFEEELHRGKTVEDITHLMINDYECNLDIPYEAFLFWGALADTQWNWGDAASPGSAAGAALDTGIAGEWCRSVGRAAEGAG